MAETPPPQQPPSLALDSAPSQYWCYHCDKRVSVETLTDLPDIICIECKNGFVESIPPPPPPPQIAEEDEPSFSHQFLQILRLIAESARDSDDPPPPPPPERDNSELDDFIRIELNGWSHHHTQDNPDPEDEDDDDDDDEDYNDENHEEVDRPVVVDIDDDENVENRSDDYEDHEEEEEEDERRRRRREMLRRRIRDFATRAATGRNRIVEWSEILMGLEETAMELRVEMAAADGYVGNPEDYVDAAGYEVLLQNLAESDGAGRRGAPPASVEAVLGLRKVVAGTEEEVVMCAICKEMAQVGEEIREMPCGHGYHGECIGEWLGARNSCPVCRFELPTDDAEYEEERKRRLSAGGGSGGGAASDSVGNNYVHE